MKVAKFEREGSEALLEKVKKDNNQSFQIKSTPFLRVYLCSRVISLKMVDFLYPEGLQLIRPKHVQCNENWII